MGHPTDHLLLSNHSTISSFLNNSPQAVIKVESLQVSKESVEERLRDIVKVDVCPPVTITQTESCLSDSSDVKERNKPTSRLEQQLSSHTERNHTCPRETMLHPQQASARTTLKTSLNLPEIIGRKEKLV